MLALVLIIEDDDAVARGLVRIIGRRCDVRRASNLRDGLLQIENADYTALICDWDLGDGIGATALARSAERSPAARRVLYTARCAGEIEKQLPPGVVDVILHKPCDAARILAALALQP